ncbi:hypothetical protein ABU614_13615 [Lysobacter firmicutimachus]|uniref:Uncharacterized protein n=1 Tax=Lysobacter firmicutimachus TaxID=1792846 RepID=A0AAU8MMN4_9GAMM
MNRHRSIPIVLASATRRLSAAALFAGVVLLSGCPRQDAVPAPERVAAAEASAAAASPAPIGGIADRGVSSRPGDGRTGRAVVAAEPPALCSSVKQYGITFGFDRAYPCGQFANGDFWVAPAGDSQGRVRIMSISPGFGSGRNGFEVNPSSVSRHGFDRTAYGYDARLVPALPYSAAPNQSIVKAISRSGDEKTSLETAAVLTVLAAPPADNGRGLFRPPYFGSKKPLIPVARLRMDRLPAYAPLPMMPALSAVSDRFRRVQLDHQLGWSADQIHPKQNMPDYGAQIAIDTASAALRLMVRDDDAQRRQLAMFLAQYALDLKAAMEGGLHFYADGGHRHGRKLVLTLGSLLLDDAAMAARVRDFQQDTYQEDGQLSIGAGSGKVLFGSPCTVEEYWENQNNGTSTRDCRDPYGYIDGGQEPAGYYQFCCTAKGYKAAALALRLMPSLRCVWTDTRILLYADRWVNHGAWTQPDPYQPRGSGALDSNPSDGTGRWPALHGAGRDDGYYGDDFADAMWAAYRGQAGDTVQCQ